MKTLKNGFAEIWEVADALAAAAFGMDMTQAKEADALRHQNLSAENKFGERLVSDYAASRGIQSLLAATKAELLAREGREMRLTLIQIAQSPALNVVAKVGGKPTPCGLTTEISLSFLRKLYSDTPGANYAEYVKALDGMLYGLQPEVAAPAPLPEHQRRLATLISIGGSAKPFRGEWQFKGITALEKQERQEGRTRTSQKIIRSDLKKAADEQAKAKKEGGAAPVTGINGLPW
jgi:hypothetical protein